MVQASHPLGRVFGRHTSFGFGLIVFTVLALGGLVGELQRQRRPSASMAAQGEAAMETQTVDVACASAPGGRSGSAFLVAQDLFVTTVGALCGSSPTQVVRLAYGAQRPAVVQGRDEWHGIVTLQVPQSGMWTAWLGDFAALAPGTSSAPARGADGQRHFLPVTVLGWPGPPRNDGTYLLSGDLKALEEGAPVLSQGRAIGVVVELDVGGIASFGVLPLNHLTRPPTPLFTTSEPLSALSPTTEPRARSKERRGSPAKPERPPAAVVAERAEAARPEPPKLQRKDGLYCTSNRREVAVIIDDNHVISSSHSELREWEGRCESAVSVACLRMKLRRGPRYVTHDGSWRRTVHVAHAPPPPDDPADVQLYPLYSADLDQLFEDCCCERARGDR